MPGLRQHAALPGASPQIPQPVRCRCGTEFDHTVRGLPCSDASWGISYRRQLPQSSMTVISSKQEEMPIYEIQRGFRGLSGYYILSLLSGETFAVSVQVT